MNPNVPQEVRIINAISEQLFNSWPVSIIMIDLEDCIWRLNQQVMNELQLNEHVIGRHITDLLEVVCDKKNVLEALLLQLRERDVRIIPLDTNCFIRELKSGISFLIQGAMVGIHEDGQLVRIVLYFRNVLEERTQKHLLNIALSRTQIFQWSFDMEHNLMIIEPRYFEYLGIPTRDYTLTPEEFAFLIHPDDRKGVFDALALQLRGNLYERPVEYRLRRGDGKWEWFEAQSTYVGQLTDLPFRIIGICMSTQKYKDTENKLNEALQKAQRSDELKSVFLANMSHEIRTPLNAIVGFSTLLACGDADLSRQEIMEFTSLIEKNSQLLMVLISDILDLSKIESNTMEFHFEKVSLNGILESIYSAQKMNLRKGVELLLDLPDRAAVIYTDPTRLGQVVNNLINNAVKFTAEGRITIGYRLKDFATLEVFVEDTGTGMSEEVLAHIFERFYKGDAFVQGTGLGLSICKSIVERLGGKITVNSEFGVGTTFNFTLPYNIIKKVADTTEGMQSSLSSQSSQLSQSSQPSDLTEQPSNETPQEQIPEKQACILIAEDTDSNYDLLNAILGKNYRLVHAHDGMEAVIMYDEVKPDLILMDIKMPNLDGLEATKIIRELSATVPIIVQSAYAYPQDQKAAKEAGCSDFISKPIVQSELKKMLNKWLSPELNNKIQE
mgnify:FL=1